MDFCSIWVCYWLIFSQHSNFIVHFQVQSQVKICSLSQFATTKVMSQLSFLYQLYQLIQLNSLVLESSPKIRLRTKGLSFIIIHMVDMLKQSIAKAILMLLRWFKSGSHVSMIGWIQRTERKHLWLENTLKVQYPKIIPFWILRSLKSIDSHKRWKTCPQSLLGSLVEGVIPCFWNKK